MNEISGPEWRDNRRQKPGPGRRLGVSPGAFEVTGFSKQDRGISVG